MTTTSPISGSGASDEQIALADHRAMVDAKYAQAGALTQAALDREVAGKQQVSRRDRWLLVAPDGRVDGVMSRRTRSAIEAFERFFPTKRERLAAAAEGWHIEIDDENGSRWAAVAPASDADGGAA